MPRDSFHLKPLTSLRFFAAMMIVIYHTAQFFDWPWLDGAPGSLVQGVSFFFVLSGFILTAVYGARDTLDPRAFMAARFARVYPAHLAGLALIVLIVPWSAINTGPDEFTAKATVFLLKATMTDALALMPSVIFSWNGVSWSLSTEMCFYLLFPFLLRDIDGTWGRKLLASALLAVASHEICRQAGLPENTDDQLMSVAGLNYANPAARLFEFCLGMAACSIWRRGVRVNRLGFGAWSAIEAATLGFVVLAVARGNGLAAAVLPVSFHAWFGVAGLCGVFAIAIVVFANGAGVIGRLLSLRCMCYLGEISFAIYLVNRTLMLAITHRGASFLASEWTYFPVLFALSALVHELVEKPGRVWLLARLKPRDAAPRPLAATPAGP